MEHRIRLSTNLLIAVKAKPVKKIRKPLVAGIQIDVNPASLQAKSRHLVDVLGNIIPAGSKEILLLS